VLLFSFQNQFLHFSLEDELSSVVIIALYKIHRRANEQLHATISPKKYVQKYLDFEGTIFYLLSCIFRILFKSVLHNTRIII